MSDYDPYQPGELDKALFAMQSGIDTAANIQSQAAADVGKYATQIAGLNIDYLKNNTLAANAILAPFSATGYYGGAQLLNMLGANGPQAQSQTLAYLNNSIQQQLQPMQAQALQTGNTSALSAINSVYGGSIFNSDPNQLRQSATQAREAANQQLQKYSQQVQQGFIKPSPLSSFSNPYAKELESVKNLSTTWNSLPLAERVQFDKNKQATAQTEYDKYVAGVRSGTIKDDQSIVQQKSQQLFQDVRKYDAQIKAGTTAIDYQTSANSNNTTQFKNGQQAFADQALQQYNKNNMYDANVSSVQKNFDNANTNFTQRQNQTQQNQQSAFAQMMSGQQNKINNQYSQQMQQANALQKQQLNTPTSLDAARSSFGNVLNKQQMQADPNFAANTVNRMVDPANNVVNNYLNNSFLNPSLQAMNRLGTEALVSSAASKGMLGSGKLMQDIYNNGQAIAGQYIIPGIQQLSGQVLQSGTTSANNELNNRTNYNSNLTSLQGNMASGTLNTAAGLQAGNAFNYANMLSGQGVSSLNTQAGQGQSSLANMFNTGTSAGTSQSQQQYATGGAVAGQNQYAADAVNSGKLASANAASSAELQKRQLQYMGTQYGLNPQSSGNSELGILGGGNMAMMGLAMLGGL